MPLTAASVVAVTTVEPAGGGVSRRVAAISTAAFRLAAAVGRRSAEPRPAVAVLGRLRAGDRLVSLTSASSPP